MISIDDVWVERAVMQRLEAAQADVLAPIRVRFVGEPDPPLEGPEAETVFARLLAVELDGAERTQNDPDEAEPDAAEVVVRVGVFVRPEATVPGEPEASALAPAAAQRTIRRLLDGYGISDLVHSGHLMTLGRARVFHDNRPDESTGYDVRVVEARGIVQRSADGDDIAL